MVRICLWYVQVSRKKFGLVCNGSLENVDRVVAKKRTALVGFDDSHKKAIKSNISKSESDHGNKKSVQNLPDEWQKEDLDVEEGQVITEKPYTETAVSRRDVSEDTALANSVKKRMSQNGDNSDRDSQRIFDILAKMEKRRERFKQPISVKIESE